MKIEQTRWTEEKKWESNTARALRDSAQLVLLFGSTALLKRGEIFAQVKSAYPQAHVLGCSTAGEITGTRVSDDSLACTAVQFESSTVKGASVRIDDAARSFEAGKILGDCLSKEGLVHVFVLSDGLKVNGTDLVRGLTESVPKGVSITGGLAGDGSSFKETVVLWDAAPQSGQIAAIGLYGARLKVGYASLGGWDSFGPERVVTRSSGNVLYELDGKSALALYKQYLGEDAKGLPGTGLHYPLAVHSKGREPLVRTLLSVDEKAQSLTFAGDVPQGAQARLMKANFDRLIEGASTAAKNAVSSGTADLAVLISCVGRKLVLNQRIEEELEAVRDVLGEKAVLTGFYSYGEISPFIANAVCELHNQTMTITTFAES